MGVGPGRRKKPNGRWGDKNTANEENGEREAEGGEGGSNGYARYLPVGYPPATL